MVACCNKCPFQTIRKTFKGIMTWINQRSRSQSNENLSLPAQPENTADNDDDDDDDTDHYENVSTIQCILGQIHCSFS